MFTTYEMMKSCTNQELLGKDLNDLVEDYRNTEDARERNKLIATIFCKVYPMILKIQKTFYMLTPEQKIEHTLYHLVKSLNSFNSKKMKFSSFFHLNLTNQLRTLLDSENSLKRAAFQNIVRNNEEALNLYIQTTPAKGIEETEEGFIQDLKNSTFLSSEEKEYCTCVVLGIEKTKDIANALKIAEKYNIKNRCTSPLIPMDKELEQKKIEKKVLTKTRQIRDSIREKREKYANKGINIFRD